ncbi:MAG: hypothetical protein IJ566_00175 [Cardiobacteriaceae bacterium]|nr:hypothetical protein [Cardiobacteriaceae bacterium]
MNLQIPSSAFFRKTNPLCKKGGFFIFTANSRLFRHFERSEKSIDSSFASLRMTAAVFGGFTVSR